MDDLRVAAIIVLLVFVTGCSKAPSMGYCVEVENRTGAPIEDVKVVFENKTWECEFGIVKDGTSKIFTAFEGMPPIPKSLTVNYGVGKSATVDVPKRMRSTS